MNDRIDNTPLNTLDRWRPGQPVSARHANQVVDAVTEMRRGVAPPRQVVRTVGGKGEEEAGLAVKVTHFHSMRTSPYGGFLYCVDDTADLAIATPTSKWFSVALPYMLRAWPWTVLGRPWVDVAGYSEPVYTYAYDRGANRVATRTSDGLEESQTITPSYTRGDPLLIAKVPSQALWYGGESPEGDWLDFNIDARSWARVDDS